MGCCNSKKDDQPPAKKSLVVEDAKPAATSKPATTAASSSTLPTSEQKTTVQRQKSTSLSSRRRKSVTKDSPKKTVPRVVESKKTPLSTVFDQYAGEDDDSDTMCEEKLEKFFVDIGLDLSEDMDIIWGLSWKLNCENLGEIDRKEFMKGFTKLGVSVWDGIVRQVSLLRKELDEPRKFTLFYGWLFNYFIDAEGGQKTLRPDEGLEYWPHLLKRWKLCNDFMAFTKIQVEEKNIRAISNDLWTLVNEFSNKVKDDMSNWAELDHGGWPSHIDEFVEYMQEK